VGSLQILAALPAIQEAMPIAAKNTAAIQACGRLFIAWGVQTKF
jgi:hypothetical protein